MAWEISITPDGWEAIYNALQRMTREELIDAIIEDNESKRQNFRDHVRWNRIEAKKVPKIKRDDLERLYPNTLTDIAYELVQANNTCKNGGYEYWIDVDGYHTVTIED